MCLHRPANMLNKDVTDSLNLEDIAKEFMLSDKRHLLILIVGFIFSSYVQFVV